MGQTRKRTSILVAVAILLLVGCSQVGLVYNRLDTIVHFQIGRYVDLEKDQRAAFDVRFNELWRWHRTTQLPLYGQDLRILAQTLAEPMRLQQVKDTDNRVRDHADRVTMRALKAAAPTLEALSDTQVAQLLAEVERRAAKELKKQKKLDDAQWRDDKVETAADRLEDWTNAVTPEQRDRIVRWASQLIRPEPDAEAARRQDFAALLKSRHDPGFEQRLETYTFEPFVGENAARNAPQTQASCQLLADLSATLTPEQRRYLQKKLIDLATQLEALKSG